MNGNCVSCGKYTQLDRSHIKTKATGGGWEHENILPMCRMCHIQQHKMGWSKFIEKRPRIKFELAERGWELEEIFGVKKLVRITEKTAK